MRVLLVALGILTVFWSTPAIELASPDKAVQYSELSALGARSDLGVPGRELGDVGRDSLGFVVMPTLDTMPVMPDQPERPKAPMMDALPVASPGIAMIDAGSVVPTSARRDLRRVAALSLNMRAGPTKRAAVLLTLTQDDGAYVTGAPKGGWVPVLLAENGQRGWVFGTFLKPTDS